MRRPQLALTFLLCASVPAMAQESGWSIGFGISGGTTTSNSVGVPDIRHDGITVLGHWQHQSSGWGALAEIRNGRGDERFADFDYTQLNLYATYDWRRDKLVRPFVKFGVSNTDVGLNGGASDSDSDTAIAFGGGLEVGRGRWAFFFSLDVTDPDIDVIDPGNKTEIGQTTAGAIFRF